jgi:HK97 family phage major capsid protein
MSAHPYPETLADWRKLLEDKLRERQQHRRTLDGIVGQARERGPNAEFTPDQERRFREARDACQMADIELATLQERVNEIEELDARATRRDRDAAAAAPGKRPASPLGDYSAARVTNEPRAFHPGGPSFFGTAIAIKRGDATGEQQDLWQRHLNEVRAGLHGEEARDIGTGAFASLVPPQFMSDLYAEALFAGRVTANVVAGHQLPDEGQTITVPRGTTSARVAAQTSENFAVQETDHGDADLTVSVFTYAGQQDLSRQSFERGRGTDEIVFAELVGDYAAKLDQDVINGPGTGGRHPGIYGTAGIASVTAAPPSTFGGKITGRQLLTNIHDAIQRVNSFRFLPATAIVMHPRRWGWLLDQSDSNGRPLLVNTGYGPQNAIGTGEAAAYGLVGEIAGVPTWTDANVPTTLSSSTFGNEDAILVFRRSDVHLWEDGGAMPRKFVFEEPGGGTLTIKLVCAGYSAFTAALRPEGIARITGSSMHALGGLF